MAIDTKQDYETSQYMRKFVSWCKSRGHNPDTLTAQDRPSLEGRFRMELLATRGDCSFGVSGGRDPGNVDEDGQEYDDPPDAADELGGADDGDDEDDDFFAWVREGGGDPLAMNETDRELLHDYYSRCIAPDRPPG